MAASRSSRLFLVFSLFVIFSCHFSLVFSHGHGHGHDHGHGHSHDEPPSFKYSKQANVPDDGHKHQHGHAHEHHGHAHEHHGHAHEHHGHAHEHHGDHTEPREKVAGSVKQKDTGMQLWLVALGSTAMISAAPVVILFLIPLDNTVEHQPFLKVLLSFASGGLLGDAFLHLIPHALMGGHSHEEGHGHGHDHGHSHTESHGHSHGEGHGHDMGVGLWVLSGIIAFLVVEKFVRYVKGGHGHSHSHAVPVKSAKVEDKKKSGDGKDKKKEDKKDEKEGDKKDTPDHTGDIEVAGYLNLAADFTHNFTDGLAIGASYLVGRNIGIITTITILLHEVPHEIGDFAILIKSGCSRKRAMLLQFSTAIGAMLGTLCSLAAEGVGDAAVAWILPFTAGGFIYIATVSVIPELLEDSKLWQSVKEICALLTGVLMMVIIAELE